MKFSVNFSIFIGDTSAYGNIDGAMEFDLVPCAGDIIYFIPDDSSIICPNISGFRDQLEVTERIFISNQKDIRLHLEDIILTSKEDAVALSTYLVKGYNFFLNEY